ncbi:MAG: 3-keto-5-aminohexanoate cleavage protein [Comamonadaceae bacterium]|nr:MAG: 3-keto-5-aminohexanoate cleavage protein [Comamonadaceae bacterium]
MNSLSNTAVARDPGSVIIEVAINGARTRSTHPHVPLSIDEIVASIEACAQNGATVFHVHAGLPVVGAGGHHDSAVYIEAFARVLERRPGLLLYPTLPGGGAGTRMAERLQHVRELAGHGMAGFIPVDPGTMNYGAIDAQGAPPESGAVYQTTFADTSWALKLARELKLPCTLSAFEPGFVRLAEAHRLAGTLPPGSIVKLEFSSGRRLFGLSPDAEGLDAWLRLFDPGRLPWMVTLRDGNVCDHLAALALARGGHVRVGLEDYSGPQAWRNEELVAQARTLALAQGRRLAHVEELQELLHMTVA